MDANLVAAIVVGGVTVVGWAVSHHLTRVREIEQRQLEFRQRRLERQLAELYGPLAILVLEGAQTFRDLQDALGRQAVFLGGKLPDEDLDTWLFWLEHDFFPRNERIKDLLSSKIHLLDGESVPQSYLDFLDHFNSWRINQMRWEQEVIAYSWRSKVGFPEAFAQDVLISFEALVREHAALLGRTSEEGRNQFLGHSTLRPQAARRSASAGGGA